MPYQVAKYCVAILAANRIGAPLLEVIGEHVALMLQNGLGGRDLGDECNKRWAYLTKSIDVAFQEVSEAEIELFAEGRWLGSTQLIDVPVLYE